jgi:aspartate kinase
VVGPILVVQKFGGTSVADASRIHLAARRAVRALLEGNQVVMVVSAMGDTTDRLVQLACQVSRRPSKRELDMLLATGEQVSIALVAMAIQEAGYEAISLTGAQVGLRTDSAHTAARIQSIDAARIRHLLDSGRIVIVAGFQGVDADFNITTLGRGGSDTTAVALSAALRAKACKIYTDVDGVYTADPRLVPTARKLAAISYDEMLELSSRGAQVMHVRALELGKKFAVPLHVQSSLTDIPGTMIMDQQSGMEDVVVRSVTLERDITRVTLFGLPSAPALAAAVFDEIASRAIPVGDITQTLTPDGQQITLSFTVQAREEGELRAVAELLAQRFEAAHLETRTGLARISAVGAGMRSHHGVAARMFRALATEKVHVDHVATSEIVISVLVPSADAERALQAVHQAFGLDRPP